MSNVIKNLKKLAKEYQKCVNDINDRIRDLEEIPYAKALVGKCYKVKNNYGMKEDSWAYYKITRAKDTTIFMNHFNDNVNGYSRTVEFGYEEPSYSHRFDSPSCIPITEDEYYKAFDELIKFITQGEKRK